MQENPLNKTELVLFDLDGTLIDTAPDFLISLNNVLFFLIIGEQSSSSIFSSVIVSRGALLLIYGFLNLNF